MYRAALFVLLGLSLFAQDRLRRAFSHPEIILPGKDILQIDPKHYRLELENEKVRVLRITLGPDETVPMHDAPAATLVCLTECHLRFTQPNGRIHDVHMEEGKARWIWDEPRSEKNLSMHAAQMLLIQSKPAGA
jgi:hypothetical protein